MRAVASAGSLLILHVQRSAFSTLLKNAVLSGPDCCGGEEVPTDPGAVGCNGGQIRSAKSPVLIAQIAAKRIGASDAGTSACDPASTVWGTANR